MSEASNKETAQSNKETAESNSVTIEALQKTVRKIQATVRILSVVTVFKFSMLVGLFYLFANLSATVDKALIPVVNRIDAVVQAVTSDDARKQQNLNLYKVFYAQCEGRFLIKPELQTDPDTERAIIDCADRAYTRATPLPPDQR